MDNYFSSPKDKAADQRLRNKFGITLKEYNDRLEKQGGVCKICGNPPKTVRLAVDHDHKFDKIKITIAAVKIGLQKVFTAAAILLNGKEVSYSCTDRKAARKQVWLILRRKSIRGLLCMNCNRGLQKFYDKPERFESAAKYLREFEGKINEK